MAREATVVCFGDANGSEGGFTVVECIVALIIIVSGVLAVVSLMDVGMRLQLESRDATVANGLARAKIEQLRNSSPSSLERCQGGSTTSNVSGYNDLPDSRFRRRWRIENPGGAVPTYTQRVTVVIVPENSGVRLPAIEIMTLMPAPLVVC